MKHNYFTDDREGSPNPALLKEMVNPLRGEIALNFAGRDFVLRPSFNSLALTENMAECGLMVLTRRFADGSFGIKDVVAVLTPPLAAIDKSFTAEIVGKSVVAEGLINVAPACIALLAAALGGGSSPL